MSSLDISLLNKSVLPSVEFKEIDLELSPVPFLENNPHIDHEREEGIITEKDRNGRRRAKKRMPALKAAFNEFNDDGTRGEKINHLLHLRKLKVNFSLSLKDRLVRGSGTWSSVDDFVGALKIKVIMCSDEKLFQKLLKNQNLFNSRRAIPMKLKDKGIYQERIIEGKAFINKESYNIITAEGLGKVGNPRATKLIDYVFDSFFVNPESTPAFLGLMAYCYFDKEDFQQRLGIDLKTNFIKRQYFGNVCKEVVVDSRGVKNSGVAFLTKQNKAVTEEVYRNSKGEYTTARGINNKKIANEAYRLLNSWAVKSPETPAGKYYGDLSATLKSPQEDNLLINLIKVSDRWAGRATDRTAQSYQQQLNSTIKTLKQLEKNETKLNAVTVPNSKLVDNRTAGIILSKKTKKTASTPQERLHKRIGTKDKGRQTISLKVPQNKNFASFTHLINDVDQYSNVNLMFGIDFIRICRDNSSYWRFFEGKDSQLISDFKDNFRILSMQIKRRDLTEPKEPEKLIVNLRERHPNQKMSFQNITPKTYKDRVLYKNPATAEEIPVFLKGSPNTKIRFFHIKDMISSDAKLKNTPGVYEYEMDLIVQDKSKDYLTRKLKRLITARRLLERYLAKAEQKCNFDSSSNSFTPLFLSDIYGVYKEPSPNNILNTVSANDATSVTTVNDNFSKTQLLIDAPWILAPSVYSSVYYQFTDVSMSDATKESERLYKRLEPSLSSPKKIRSAIKQFQDLISYIRDEIGPIRDNSTNNSGPGITKSRKSNQRIEVNHKFKDKVLKKKSHNFKGFLEFSSPTSPPIISYRGYLNRVNTELEGLMADSAGLNTDTDVLDEVTSAITNLEQTKLGFLSPSIYSTPNIKVNMNKASLAKRTDKNVYSALFGEISNINLSVDKDIRQVVSPTNKKGITTQMAMTQNQLLNSENLLAKFGVSLTDDPDDEIELDIIPRFVVSKWKREDGLVNSQKYLLGLRSFSSIRRARKRRVKKLVMRARMKKLENSNPIEVTNAVVSQIATSGLISNNKMSIAPAGTSNVFDDNSPTSLQTGQKAYSMASYDIANPDNIFNNLNMSANKISKLPNHIKSLALMNKSIGSEEDSELDVDRLASSQTKPYYMMQHFDLVEVKALVGFEKDKDTGRLFLNAPIYQTLDIGTFQNTNGNLLCKLQPYVMPAIGVSMATILDLEISNANFMIGSRPTIETGQKERIKTGHTSGGDLFLKDGTEYMGFYHMKKDGTIFSGKRPQKATKDKKGSEELFTIERGFSRRQAYMMKMNSRAKFGAKDRIEREIKANLLNSSNKQKLIPKEYVRTSNINMSNKLISTRIKRRKEKMTVKITQSAANRRGKNKKYGNPTNAPTVNKKNFSNSRDPVGAKRRRRFNRNKTGGSGY